jgi:hypothetical protein
VTFEDWQTIDKAELTAAAGTDAPRRKLTGIPDMLAVLD